MFGRNHWCLYCSLWQGTSFWSSTIRSQRQVLLLFLLYTAYAGLLLLWDISHASSVRIAEVGWSSGIRRSVTIWNPRKLGWSSGKMVKFQHREGEYFSLTRLLRRGRTTLKIIKTKSHLPSNDVANSTTFMEEKIILSKFKAVLSMKFLIKNLLRL